MVEPKRLRNLWKRTTRLDLVGLGIAVLLFAVHLGSLAGISVPFSGFVDFLALVFLVPLALVRLLQLRDRLLWSLRSRLVVAYLFVAVVPLLLVVLMAWRTADLLYTQLGIYLLNQEIRGRIDRVQSTAEAIAASLPPTLSVSSPVELVAGQTAEMSFLLERAKADLQDLKIRLLPQSDLVRPDVSGEKGSSALVQKQGTVWIHSIAVRNTQHGRIIVSLEQPITAQILDGLTPAVGKVQIILFRFARPDDPPGIALPVGDRRLISIAQLAPAKRSIPAPAHLLDFEVGGVAQFQAQLLDKAKGGEHEIPVFAPFSTRTSLLNAELFRVVGNFGLGVTLLYLFGIVFLVLEILALIVGIQLTRTITRAVADLYSATQRVQSGDLTHRVRIERRDQLGVLGESFNEMTNSVAGLIEEQKQRQRLENELSIAQEVQSQLFPQTLPQLPGIELAAVCRAARVVSGDYYDFIQLEKERLGLALADISGKGISAALLMASLQAALRSQALLDGTLSTNTAELVQRLNKHLFVNTSDDRYATFFFAVYDPASRILRYTNAGHLPPLYVIGERVQRLEEGGTVVGLIDECSYSQGELVIEPEGILVAYSDGLVEPENVYGQEFGSRRLEEEVLRNRHRPPHDLAEALVRAAEEWGGTPEQADDMTVIVARVH